MKRTSRHASQVFYQDEREPSSGLDPLPFHDWSNHETLLILLNDIMLGTSLGSLSIIMPLPRAFLTLSISQRTSHGPANAAFDSFPNSRSIILQLTFGFLALAFSILALSLLFETVGANSVTDCFFGSTNRLVVRALGAVRVVCRYAAGWRDGNWAEFAD